MPTPDPDHVPYAEIPEPARKTLDEMYTPRGVEIWWNSPSEFLHHYLPSQYRGRVLTPRDHPEAAAVLAEGIADGIFF